MNEDLTTLSDTELLEKLKELEDKWTFEHIQQYTRKIQINSLYGALGNQGFRYFDIENAEAVTAMGQLSIKWVMRKINEWLNKQIGTDGVDYVVYGDTDSVVGDTIIEVNGNKLSIAEYYDSIPDDNLVKDTPKDFVKTISGDFSLSMSKDMKVENKPINYIMKHKVKKHMYKITVDGNSVTVTEDHSVIISRDGELLDVKPIDIKKGDKIIKIN